MLDYDTESRLQLAREHAERLADDMRRTGRLKADAARYPIHARIGELLGRAARADRKNEAEPNLPAYYG